MLAASASHKLQQHTQLLLPQLQQRSRCITLSVTMVLLMRLGPPALMMMPRWPRAFLAATLALNSGDAR